MKRYRVAKSSFPKRLGNAMVRAAQDMSLLTELALRPWYSLLDSRRHGRVHEYASYLTSLEDLLVRSTGRDLADVESVLEGPDLQETLREAGEIADKLGLKYREGFGAAGAHGQFLYTLCRLRPPEISVELGVMYGWSTFFILAALEKNGRGHLYSIDRPGYSPGLETITGIVVPQRLASRWTLWKGTERNLLPKVLGLCPSVDIFHYDSAKTYREMLRGFELAWPCLSSGGVLISDDLINDAFLNFAESRRVDPMVVTKHKPKNRVGVVVHP